MPPPIDQQSVRWKKGECVPELSAIPLYRDSRFIWRYNLRTSVEGVFVL